MSSSSDDEFFSDDDSSNSNSHAEERKTDTTAEDLRKARLLLLSSDSDSSSLESDSSDSDNEEEPVKNNKLTNGAESTQVEAEVEKDNIPGTSVIQSVPDPPVTIQEEARESTNEKKHYSRDNMIDIGVNEALKVLNKYPDTNDLRLLENKKSKSQFTHLSDLPISEESKRMVCQSYNALDNYIVPDLTAQKYGTLESILTKIA